jgi:hypothetical protein
MLLDVTTDQPSSRDDVEPEVLQYPEGSLEQASPSLRYMAANAYTFEGQRERGFIEGEMARAPGWRKWVLIACALAGLAWLLFGLVSGVVSLITE